MGRDSASMTGRVVVMGSGELAPGLVATHRAGLEAGEADAVTVIDTPYGFQENADDLTARIVDFFGTSLGLPVAVASMRDLDEDTVTAIRARATIEQARYVFAGPGSPTYALAVWRAHEVAGGLEQVLTSGGTVCFASAAALTLGSHTIPVYEIYKVGERPRWEAGLDLLATAGLSVPIVPHWDNAEGGTHDTSHCYVGARRFEGLMAELATGAIGIDEHTAATFDLEAGMLEVTGRGAVTLWTHESETKVDVGERVPLDEVAGAVGSAPVRPGSSTGDAATSTDLASALRTGEPDAIVRALSAVAGDDPAALVQLAELAAAGARDPADRIGGFVDALLTERTTARDEGRWEAADRIRDQLAGLGVEVRDTADGPTWHLVGD